jgi:hypothetical protein
MSFEEAENSFFPDEIYGARLDEILEGLQGIAASEPDSDASSSYASKLWDRDSFLADVRKTISQLPMTEEPRYITLNDGTIVQL